MEENKMILKNINELGGVNKNNTKIYTNIDDEKTIFNLENKVDYKINDCEGQTIIIKNVLIKRIEKMLEKPEIEEETGEIKKDREIKIITILIDDLEKSYVTASKSFGYSIIKFIEMFGLEEIEEKGLPIKIIKKPVQNSGNKALSFELV